MSILRETRPIAYEDFVSEDVGVELETNEFIDPPHPPFWLLHQQLVVHWYTTGPIFLMLTASKSARR